MENVAGEASPTKQRDNNNISATTSNEEPTPVIPPSESATTPVRRTHRRAAFIHPMESDLDGWLAPLAPATLDEFSCLTVRGFQGFVHTEQLEDDKPDSAPSNLIPDLAGFTADKVNALYESLLEQVAEMHLMYARLLSHLDVASKISTETESLLRACFFQQHNLAAQFEMYGMHRCARHLRQVEAKLALFPPIYNQYQLYNLSTEASQQMERLWVSPTLFHQLVGTYQVHLKKLPLPK